MPQSYSVDIRKLTYRELWRLAPGLSFLVAAFVKTFGVPLKTEATVRTLEALPLVEESQIPSDVAARLGGLVDQWRDIGFTFAWYYTLPAANPKQRCFAAALLSQDGGTCGQVLYAEAAATGQVQSELQANCFSALSDGTFFGVSSARKRMDGPPEVRGIELPGKPPRALYERHLRELARTDRSFPVPHSAESLRALLLRTHNRHVEFHASRGVYVPLGG